MTLRWLGKTDALKMIEERKKAMEDELAVLYLAAGWVRSGVARVALDDEGTMRIADPKDYAEQLELPFEN